MLVAAAVAAAILILLLRELLHRRSLRKRRQEGLPDLIPNSCFTILSDPSELGPALERAAAAERSIACRATSRADRYAVIAASVRGVKTGPLD